MPGSRPESLTVAVVGATGAVGRTMTQVLLEKAFPMTELRLLASERSAGRRVTVGGRELEVGLATPEAFEGVDIALFSAGGETSKALAPEAAARGAAVIDNSSAWRMDPDGPARRVAGQPGRPRLARGHHRQPQLLDDAARAAADGAARRGGPRADRGRHLPERGRDRPQGDRRARGAGQGPRRGPPQGRQRLPAPDRVQRPAAHRRVPRQRVHEGGVEGRHREPQDPAPARPAGLVHGRPRPGVRQPLRGGPRRDARSRSRPAEARALFAAVSRASWSRTIPPPTNTRWPRTPPGRTTCSSAGSARTCRSTATAASRSGSCPTTCARAPRPTPSRSPRSSSSAAGSGGRASGADAAAPERGSRVDREPVGASGGRTA